MKRMMYIPLVVLIATPSIASAEVQGELSVGLRTTHFAGDDKSAKFDEYRDMSNGLFGDVNLLFDNQDNFLGLTVENPSLDDQFYELRGGQYGLGKARLYFDELTHQLSRNALTPTSGIGSNILTLPATVPPVSQWTPIDYQIDKEIYGAEFTVDPQQIPFYFKVSVEQQKSDGIMPWGTTFFSLFESAMPVDYTTDNLMLEGGYRDKQTTAVLTGGYSVFKNDNDLLITVNDTDFEEYSTPADNYSYNFGGRLTQRLPMESVLALKASYIRNKSEADWSDYTQLALPSADNDFDGDVEYIRGSAALTSQWTAMLDTRLFYNYVDRNNNSEDITALDDGATNLKFEYDKHDAGLDVGYRPTRDNKLTGGYEFSYTDRNREDADTTTDNLVFAQLKNSSLDWMSTKLRLEYLNRSSDTDFSPETLTGDGLINQFFTPFDYADKDRYKAKVAFEFYPTESLNLGLSYALAYDDYDASLFGVQNGQHQEFYVNLEASLPAKIRLSTYAGYEYTKTSFDSRRFNPGGADPTTAPTTLNYNWNQDATYDFFVIGGSLTIPVIQQLDLVFSADHQLVDGNIDFARPAAAGVPLGTINNADDYYKTQLGAKSIYRVTDAWSVTLGYLFEKSNLDEWKYDNFSYTPGTPTAFYLSGAGLDNEYEAHQVYMITTFHF
jgi:MtrB/PioB family decaheme-associated outer membrane protein